MTGKPSRWSCFPERPDEVEAADLHRHAAITEETGELCHENFGAADRETVNEQQNPHGNPSADEAELDTRRRENEVLLKTSGNGID